MRAFLKNIAFSSFVLFFSKEGYIFSYLFQGRIRCKTKPEAKAKQLAEKNKIDIKLYKVIYDAVDDITNIINGMMTPKYEEVVTGHAEVRQIFKISSIGNIAGSYVLDGQVNRDSKIRVMRNGQLIADTAIDTLQHMKDQVKSVKLGYECGIKLKGFNDIEVGDILEAYSLKQI